MIIKLIKKSAKTIFIAPAIPLYFVLALIVFKLISPFAMTSNIPLISAILLICLFLLSSCFLSGWFQILKDSSQLSLEEIKEKKFFPVFLEGVGKNLLPISSGVIIYITLSLIFILTACFIASKVFGDLTLVMKNAIAIGGENVNLIEFINNLDKSEKEILYGWQIFILLSMAILDFILMFYPTTLVDNIKENVIIKPFCALFRAIKFLFKNFLGAISIYILIYAVYILIEVLGSLSAFSEILTIIVLFIHIYFISFALMVVFNYYDSKKQKEDNCSNGCDCIGQNEPCDTISEENK